MKRIIPILILCLLCGAGFAKDPMKRGKASFPTTKPYPQVDVSGYEEIEFNSLEQSGDPRQYQSTTEYTSLPASVKVYDGLRHRRLIDLEGQISEKLYVRYKIQQEPDLPQETDIYVEYDKFSIYFGKYDAMLANGEMFSMNKNIDGLHADYIDTETQFEGIYGEERSHKREFSFQGNGKREYRLGQTNILEGSLKIRRNGGDVPETDYQIDYIEGRIIFNSPLSAYDVIEGNYEYLDPIEDFLPIQSKVRLSGIQHRYNSYSEAAPVIVTQAAVYTYDTGAQTQITVPWDALVTATTMTYSDNTLALDVAAPDVTGVTLFCDSQTIPLKNNNGRFQLSMPLSRKERPISIQYDTAKYSVARDCQIRFVDQASSENAGSTTPSTLVENIPSAGYRVVFPEGLVIINQSSWTEQKRLVLDFIPAAASIDVVQIQFKTETVSMQKTATGYHLEYDLPQEGSLGLQYAYIVFPDLSMTQRKIPFVVTGDQAKADVIERIELPNKDLSSFTEVVWVSGNRLTENKDYRVDYQQGRIIFLKSIPKQSAISVNYVYQQSLTTKEKIQGTDSKGPYKLGKSSVIPGSVGIVLGETIMQEYKDFTVDYRTGAITFARKITPIETPEIEYRSYVLTNTAQAQQRRKVFSMSSYFVQEKAKAAEALNFDSVSLKGTELESVSSNGTMTVIKIGYKYQPIIKDSIKVYIGTTITAAAVVQEYNGYILVTGNYVTANVSVDFQKAKPSQAPPFTFNGSQIQAGTVILNQVFASMPRPIVYGSLKLEHKGPGQAFYQDLLVWNQNFIVGESTDLDTTITNNTNATVRDNQTAWERGIITFVTRNAQGSFDKINPYSSADEFRVVYEVANTDKPDPGDIVHQTYGTKIDYAPIDALSIGVEYNESSKEFQRQVSDGLFDTVGNNSDAQQVQLVVSGNTSLELVEDSEKVYVNDVLQTRNDDYSITYKGGLIKFKAGLLLSPQDRIRIVFRYYSFGTGQLEELRERAKAVKVDTVIHAPARTDIGLTYVTVDEKYDPVGNAPGIYTAGTEAKKLQITSTPIDRLNLDSSVQRLDQKSGEFIDDQSIGRYQKTIDQHYGINYGFNAADTFSFVANRKDVTLPDRASADYQSYEIDTIAYDTEARLGVGPDTFRTAMNLRNAESFSDVMDRLNTRRLYNRVGGITNTYKPWSDLTFTSGYSQNKDDEFYDYRRVASSKFYSESIRWTPWTIETALDLSAADYETEKSIATDYYEMDRTFGKDRRHVYNLTFRRPPELADSLYEELYMHFDDMYDSKASDLYNQQPNLSRADNFNATIRPYDVISYGYDDAFRRNILDNHTTQTYSKENKHRFSRFYPMKYTQWLKDDFLIVNQIEYTRRIGETRSDSRSVYGLDQYNELGQTYSVNPLDNLLFDLQYNYKNTNRYEESSSVSGYSESSSILPIQMFGLDMTYDIDELSLLKNIKSTWTRDYSLSKNHRRTLETTGAVTNTKDDLEKNTDAVSVKYNYLERFTNTHTLTTLEEFKQKSAEGTRLTRGQTNKLETRYDTPITGLGLSYSLTKVYDLQFQHPEENVGKYSIDKNFNNKLFRTDDTNQLMGDYTFIPELTFDASVYYRRILQQMRNEQLNAAKATAFGNQITIRSYEFGLTYRPWTDASMRYAWKKDIFDYGFGEVRKLTADYKPLQFDFGDFSYHYENIYTLGRGTNDPEQESNLNNLQGFVQTRVVDRDDIKVINTLIFKVNKEIANVIVDNMVIDVNLTRLHLWDRQNPDYSYSLNAFYAKGTLNF